MVSDYEKRERMSFQYVIRIRPDLFFMEPMPTMKSLSVKPGEIIVPAGVAPLKGTYGVNDHIAICERSTCDPYFLLHDKYENCKDKLDMFTSDGNEFLEKAVNTSDFVSASGPQKMTFRRQKMDYTIMRKCPHSLDCFRFNYPPFDSNSSLADACKQESKIICPVTHTQSSTDKKSVKPEKKKPENKTLEVPASASDSDVHKKLDEAIKEIQQLQHEKQLAEDWRKKYANVLAENADLKIEVSKLKGLCEV